MIVVSFKLRLQSYVQMFPRSSPVTFYWSARTHNCRGRWQFLDIMYSDVYLFQCTAELFVFPGRLDWWPT